MSAIVRALLALSFICLVSSSAAAAGLERAEPLPGAHVRGATHGENALIREGVRRSQTFAKIVDQINGTDVVVYVSRPQRLPSGLDGRLTFMTSAGGIRYLHAEVIGGLGPEDTLSILGHELQHALEVAMHPEVRDSSSLGVLYERIGEKQHVANRFDTAAARRTGSRVRQELQ